MLYLGEAIIYDHDLRVMISNIGIVRRVITHIIQRPIFLIAGIFPRVSGIDTESLFYQSDYKKKPYVNHTDLKSRRSSTLARYWYRLVEKDIPSFLTRDLVLYFSGLSSRVPTSDCWG